LTKSNTKTRAHGFGLFRVQARGGNMRNFMSFVNEQLRWEEESPHRHDCHDPPHTAGTECLDDRSLPRRFPAVARSDPWKTTPAQVGFPGHATRRRRLPWVMGSDLWNSSRGKDYLLTDRRGEDCHPEQEFCALAALGTPLIARGACALTCGAERWHDAKDHSLQEVPQSI
jgi:hypothetical protein